MRITLIYLAIVFSIICMSTSSILIRYCTAPAVIIALYRVVFTSSIAAFIKGSHIRSSIAEISRRDFFYILGAGFFLALHFGFWITSLGYTSISSSVLFTNLQVIFVMVFSIVFLREKLNAAVIMGIMTALMGSIFIALGDLQLGKLLGDMLALLSGFFVAIYFIIGRNVRARVDAMTYTCIVSAVAAVVLLAGCLSTGLTLGGYPAMDWLLFILMGLGPGIAGHGILNWALKYIKAPIVAVSILGESVGASILAYLLFQELLLWYQIIGGVLILAGIYIAAAFEKKAAASADNTEVVRTLT